MIDNIKILKKTGIIPRPYLIQMYMKKFLQAIYWGIVSDRWTDGRTHSYMRLMPRSSSFRRGQWLDTVQTCVIFQLQHCTKFCSRQTYKMSIQARKTNFALGMEVPETSVSQTHIYIYISLSEPKEKLYYMYKSENCNEKVIFV